MNTCSEYSIATFTTSLLLMLPVTGDESRLLADGVRTKSPRTKSPLINHTPRTKSPYDRALMSTAGYCIAHEKLRILSFYTELKH